MSSDQHNITVSGLGGEVQDHTEVKVNHCYQCGKCSAGCPLSDEMDFPPSMIMRMLQTGDPKLEDKVLRSYSIWVCLTCEMCYARCPMSIDIPKVMDFLREKAIKEKKANPKAKEIIDFHRSFLDTVRYTGKMYEVGFYAEYKTRTLKLLNDMTLVPPMMKRGKLHFIPEMVKDRSAIGSIFRKTIKKK